MFISLCGTKKRTKEKPPLAFRVPTNVGIPSPGTFSRGRYKLAHPGAQTA